MCNKSYAIYESEKAMEDFNLACQLAPMKQIHGYYISEETAAANLEMSKLFYEAYLSDPKS